MMGRALGRVLSRMIWRKGLSELKKSLESSFVILCIKVLAFIRQCMGWLC